MSSRARKPRRDGDSGGGGSGAAWLGALIIGVGTAVAMGVGYLIGREEGREEREQRVAAEEEATGAAAARGGTASSCSSSRNNLADADDFPRIEPYAGAAGATPSASSSPSHVSPDDFLCKVCLEHPNDHVFLPCSHQACCGSCASQLSTCPICHKHIQSVIKIYKS